MADTPHRGSRIGKALLWGTGLAAIPGIVRGVAKPAKDLATETQAGLRRNTPTLQEARVAWSEEVPEDPAELFVAYARKFGLDETGIAALERQYTLLFGLSTLAVLGSLVLLYWNLSGLLLAVLSLFAGMGSLYRRDALHYRRLPTFRNWLRERLWWIFG